MENNRRNFLKTAGLSGLGLVAASPFAAFARNQDELDAIGEQAKRDAPRIFNMSGYAAPKLDVVRVGIIASATVEWVPSSV